MMKLCVVGAGPIGLEMAVRAVRHGLDVCVVERGASIAANVREWQHVELFSPWSINVSATGREVLKEMGAPVPDESVFPTGAALIAEYLQVLEDFLCKSGRCEFKFNSELISIGRSSFLKWEHIGANGKRKGAPFRLLLQSAAGEEELVTDCNFLVDSSGTWNQPNWCGAGGVPAVGERKLVKAGRILQHIPDPALAPQQFLGKRICVVGSGASAITSINALQRSASAAKNFNNNNLMMMNNNINNILNNNDDNDNKQ